MEEHQARKLLRDSNVLVDMEETRSYREIAIGLGLMVLDSSGLHDSTTEAYITDQVSGSAEPGNHITASGEV